MTTIYDVAQIAHVSIKTVSRVLNNHSNVRENTRKKVLKVIKELDYFPSIAARSMVTQKSGLIGVITSAITSASETVDLAGLASIDMVKGIQFVIESAGKTLIIADTGGIINNVEKLANTFREHRVEGIILLTDSSQSVLPPPSFKGLPSILVNCFDSSCQIPSVMPDDEVGGYLSAKSAFEKGHIRLGFLSDPKDFFTGKTRSIGFRKAHEEMGIKLDADLIVEGYNAKTNFETDSINQQMKIAIDQLLNISNPPTVICVSNDRMAINLYNLLRQNGINIPQKISVIACNNYSKVSELLDPSLTTIELPYFEVGCRGAEKLLKFISGELVSSKHRKKINKKEYLIESMVGKVVWRDSLIENL